MANKSQYPKEKKGKPKKDKPKTVEAVKPKKKS